MADNFDPAYLETEDIIAELEKKLQREYRRASEEAEEKLKKYLEKFEKKDAEKKREMSYGLINEDEYKEWRKRQILQLDRYQAMVDTLAEQYVHANEDARAMIAGDMPEIYAINANYAAYEAEGYGSIQTSFALYNAGAVRELALHDADLLPLPSPKRLEELAAKDMLWNRQLVSSSLMQSILAGESVPKMAQRLAQSVSEKNYNSAVRAARTFSTAVQNKARADEYVRAKARGSKIQKQVWLATLDGRTRHAHRQLDQQETEVGEPWEVDRYEIRFPSDPNCPAYLIYNCRCRIRGVIEGLERLSGKDRDYSAIGGMSYEEWKASKAKNESWKTIEKRKEAAAAEKEPEKPKIKEIEFQKAEKAGTAMSYLNRNGFTCEQIPMDISKESFIGVANRLAELNTQFKVVGKGSPIPFKTRYLGDDVVAQVNGNFLIGRDTSIEINNYYYKNNAFLIKSHKRMEKKGWSMKAAEDRAAEYDITHEYGHLLQDSMLFTDDYRKGVSKCKDKKEKEAFFRKHYVAESDRHRREIIKIAKESDPDFDVSKYISDYGRSDSNEFFAECFANARCGNPNALGDAMNEWLRRNGFDA